jgi:O-antigen/teichoic acid export membrane protein
VTPTLDSGPDELEIGLAEIESREAGDRIIRGGAFRASGYLFSTGATAVAFALLLRHLGVEQFGRFSTVIALVTIASGLSDLGLQVIAQRRFAAADDHPARRKLVADVVGIRLAFAPLAVALCTAFALVAGYNSTMVMGTAVAGLGAMVVVLSASYAIPLAMHLRYFALTFVDVARQLVIVVGIVLLVVAGAGLGPFFVVYLAAGFVLLALTVLVVGRSYAVLPRLGWGEWRPILIETAPLALSLAINVLYLKVLIVMASLLVSAEQVGLFATASRVTEVLVGLPTFMIGVAFPLLAHAGKHDEERLVYALQRIVEVTLLVAVGFVVVLVVAAEPIIQVFGGSGYAAAVPVLRIQALALLGASLTQAWIQGVVAVHAQRALVLVNVVALISVMALGAILIPTLDAQGAAIAAACGEAIMAATMLRALVRARPALRPNFAFAWRVILAGGLALLPLLLPVSPAVQGVLTAAVFGGAALVLRAVPLEVFQAFMPARSSSEPA